jgi:regulator of protease activity HflC (stomatin/prohibitin superfamily)
MLIRYLLCGTGAALVMVGVALLGRSLRWRRAGGWLAGGLLCFVLGQAVAFVPSGHAAVRVSQLRGTRPGTLYPGLHLVVPFVEQLALYDTRERVLDTARAGQKPEPLTVQSKEGLTLGLSLSVRYRLDPQRLAHLHGDLEAPEQDLVPTVVASSFRELVPGYSTREVFSVKREELRRRASDAIAARLASDGILVREVLLRDVGLPAEYARGLEGLLLKEQENERMVYDLQVKEKQVRQAELEAEAEKARQVKAAEAAGQVRVLQAKAEADAMQHTLPLKEKQIQQTRLEAEARKEARLKDAEAAAEAKVIDSKAEVERTNLMAGADAHRVRVMAAAESERLKLESDLLKENPLLIQKMVAERISDKLQIMMVPMDGRGFFANDVFKAAAGLGGIMPPDEGVNVARPTQARR